MNLVIEYANFPTVFSVDSQTRKVKNIRFFRSEMQRKEHFQA